jgi:hypothetical protein
LATHRINWTRVLLGGLLAGVIVNASGMALVRFVLGPEYVENFLRVFPSEPRGLVMLVHVGTRLWFGMLAVFLYAAFRPRFGPGPRTALIAAATVWLSAYLVATTTLIELKLLTGLGLWITIPWTLAEICTATVLGASIYREQAT